MRFRLLLLLSLPVLLAACAKTDAPVRLDFIGNTTLTSGNKVVNPNDTLTTRAYAVGNDNPLHRLLITVTYSPGIRPFIYPTPLTSYDPTKDAPGDTTITYLDSLIVPISHNASYTSPYAGGEYLFQNKFKARSTSGAETWQYTVFDNTGASSSRALRLTARKTDSAFVYHSYRLLVRPQPGSPVTADSAHAQARVFMGLNYGLLLPKYALLNQVKTVQLNQQLIDLICTTTGTGSSATISLGNPDASNVARFLSPSTWPLTNRHHTQLRSTALSTASFTAANTTALFATAFASGQRFPTDSLSTGTLVKSSVVAFRTYKGKLGLMLITDLTTGTRPLLTCDIKVQK